MKQIFQATVVLEEVTFALELNDTMSKYEIHEAFKNASDNMSFSMKAYVKNLTILKNDKSNIVKPIIPVT